MAMNHNTGAHAHDDRNPDPITGAPGSHPVGTGVGAAGGAAAGAAIGTAVGGPIGTAVGAVAGGIAGGFAGKGVAEGIDPTAEDAYWRENYKTRPYAGKGRDYTYYAPAYRYGWESRGRHAGHTFEQVESDLRTGWERDHGDNKAGGLGWDKAKLAVRDAWDHCPTRAVQSATSASYQHQQPAATASGKTTIPVVEEQLQVGKHQVETGGARVQTRVEERPAQAEVNLREEHLRVERHPVDRPATAADVTSAARPGSVEVRTTKEVPVLEKETRVVEEVVIDKKADQRTQTVRDTVRRTDVDVKEVGPDASSSSSKQKSSTDR